MRRIFRFRYRKDGIPALNNGLAKSEYGVANIEVYCLWDIEELMLESGLGLHDVFIVPVGGDDSTRTRHGIWNERNFVFAYKGKKKQVFVGECNFYEADGKRDS